MLIFKSVGMIKILLIEGSYLIRKGIVNLIDELNSITEIKEVATHEDIAETISSFLPNIIIINTIISSIPEVEGTLKSCDDATIISIFNNPMPGLNMNNAISVYDSKTVLLHKLKACLKIGNENKTSESNTEELSDREKDVLKEIALGKTNKEIAANLFISSHTVISHRKNITRKLGIKTVSGLTVYAILNQLISVEEIS